MLFNDRIVTTGGYFSSLPVTPYHFSREIYDQTRTLITPEHSPVIVAGDGATNNAALFGGSLPDFSTRVVINPGSDLTVPAGTDFVAYRVQNRGTVTVQGATAPNWTRVIVNQWVDDPGGKIVIDMTNGNRVKFLIVVDDDIDVEDDPHLLSRSFISLGETLILGKPRQRVLPINHTITGGPGGTVSLTLSRTPFLGNLGSGGDPNNPLNYSRHTLDWLGTEKYILPGLTRPSSNTQPLKSEIVQGASFTLNENSTAFSTKDTQGSILTLAAPPILTKTEHWNAEALAIARAFGPPPGSPTFGSHSWIGACWVLNPNSNVQWLMATQTSPGVFEEIDIDTAVPTHRRPMIMVSSARARIEQTERRRFGRTEMTQLTSIPGSVTHTATTNLRHRHSMQLYDAGYPQWHDLLEGKNCARVVLNTSWDGGDPGTAYQNGTIGEGSRSCAIAQYHSGAYVEGNICDNQIGAGHWVGSSHDLYVRRHNVFSSTWSMYPLGTPPLFKEGTHYNTADSGRAGAGGESYSRNGFNNRNLYLGNKSHCYIVLSRSTEQVTDWDVRKMPDSPAMIQYSQRGNSLDDDDRPRFRAEGEYSQGNGGGSVISKNRPQQHHGWRTHIKFHVSVDDGGIAELFEYTGNYDLEKHIILCPPDHNPFAGYAALTLLSSTYGFRSVDFFIANPVRGVYDQRQKPGFPPVALTPAETQNWFIDFAFLNAGTEFINVPTEGADNRVISLSGNYDGPFGCDITEVQEAPNAGPGNQVRYVGTARTPFGDTIYPFPTPSDESGGLPVPGTRMGGAVSQYGYWTNSDPGASPPYFSLYELAITNDLPPNQELTVLYPLPIRIPPANLAAVWTHTTGAKKTITHHGSASYTDAVAAARTAFQNGAF